MNQIIYFHGYASDGNSRTAENIRQELTNYQIISPKYDTKNADYAYNDLSNMVDYGCKKSDFFYLIGNSLGGFWANYFSNKYKIPTLLINPSLDPVNSLKKYENIDLETYSKYYLKNVPGLSKVVVLGKKDEIIPFETFLNEFQNNQYIIHINENMGHRVESKEQIAAGLNDLISLHKSL